MTTDPQDSGDSHARLGGWLTQGVREYTLKAIVTLAAGSVGLVAIFLTLRQFDVRPSELSMSASGMSVKLERRLPNGVEYFMAVSPQVGWQDTDIEIKTGDDVSFWASGQVNLSIFRINESVIERRLVEARINCMRDATQARPCTDPRAQTFAARMREDSSTTPEAFFADSELVRMQPRQPWLGPMGDTISADRSYPGRTMKKLAPALPYGQLVALILPKAEDPTREHARQAFTIGTILESKGGSRPEKKTGDLWLAVNDVWNGSGTLTGSRYPDNLFTLDNVGFFWVRISVVHK